MADIDAADLKRQAEAFLETSRIGRHITAEGDERQLIVLAMCGFACDVVAAQLVELFAEEQKPSRSSCDVCGAIKADDEMSTVFAYGIETNACDDCRGR